MKDHITPRIESLAFEPETVQVASFVGREVVSRLFSYEVHVISSDPAGFDETKLLTNLARITLERNDSDAGGALTEERQISGMVCALRDRATTEANQREYVLTFVPRMWRTTLTVTSDIFMDVTVPDILKAKLTSNGFEGADFEMRLNGRYEPREFVVQYKESDFDFICRLTEDLGISFWFEQKDGKDVIVFGDANASARPASPAKTSFAMRGDRTNVYELEATRQVVTKSFKTRDYNYRNPSMDVLGEAANETLAAVGSIDEFGAHAKTPGEATQYAKLRAEEANARHLTFEGASDLPGIRAGSVIKVEGHPRGKLELFVTEVAHESRQAAMGMSGSSTEVAYACKFRAIPKSVEFRPPRITPKPVVNGVVTGVIESSGDKTMGAVDDQGRYRVSFAYDTVSGRGEAKASRPLRMAQPSAGSDRGFHQPLRAGTEVVITCLNGDPDRPIIAGAVPNPQTPSPVTSANAEKSMWKTNVNQIAIDDAKPRMKMTVNGDDHVFQVGESNFAEFGVSMGTVGNYASMATGVATSYSAITTAIDDYKTSLSAKDVVAFAGIKNEWSKWKWMDVLITQSIGMVKSMSAVAGTGYAVGTDLAKAKKKKVDDALEAAKAKAAKDLALDTKPKKVENPDGTFRDETAGEARDRALKEAITTPISLAEKNAAKDLQAATDAAAAAAADVKAHEKAWEESKANIGTGDTADVMKHIDGGLAAIKAIGVPLYSMVSKFIGKASQDLTLLAMQAIQTGAAATMKASGERSAGKMAGFATPMNVQGATNSVGINGMGSVLIFGKDSASMVSKDAASVISSGRIDLKAFNVVETSGQEVLVTATDLLDLYSDKKVLLASHKNRHARVPTDHSMYVLAQEHMLVESTDKDVIVKAKKNLKCTAETEGIDFKCKTGFKTEVEKGPYSVETKDGKVMFKATNGNVALHSNKDFLAEANGGDVLVDSTKGNATVNAGKTLTLKCKTGEFKATGNLNLKGSNISVTGKMIKLG